MSLSAAIESCQSSRVAAGRFPLNEAGRMPLRGGTVLWDLRPLHECQRAPVPGAINLGQIDWLVEDHASGRLQPPSVIAKILARVGIVSGCSVVLYAGDRAEALPLARRALSTIGIDEVTGIVEADEDPVALPRRRFDPVRGDAAIASGV